MENLAVVIFSIIGALLLLIIFFLANYVKVRPNNILIITGRKTKYQIKNKETGELETVVKKFKIVSGGAAFVIPFLERKDLLPLDILTIDIKTSAPVPTKQYIPVKVDAVANIKVSSDHSSIMHAAQQFLNGTLNQIKDSIIRTAKEVLEGNMREVIGQLTLEELIQNREEFGRKTQESADRDMSNMGLEIINLTVQAVDDTNNIIKEMAAKNEAEIKKIASIARAEAEKDTTIKTSQAKFEAHQAEIQAETKIAENIKNYNTHKLRLKVEEDELRAIADVAYNVKKLSEDKNIIENQAVLKELETKREADISKQKVLVEKERLNVSIREKTLAETDARRQVADTELYETEKSSEASLFRKVKEIEAYKNERLAEAELELELAKRQADAIKLRAKAEAEAVELNARAEALRLEQVGLAEAKAISAKGLAEAEAIDKKAEAMAKFGDAAIVQLIVEKLPEIANNVSAPLANVDRITMYGEGNASKLVGDNAKNIASVMDILKDTAGVDIKQLIERVSTGGILGRNSESKENK